ncbi:MAG: 4-hydroxy-tetrahydrodipicolinate reductase [Bacteroidales bacterium]|nr:4-hydroxy-tetrahydrodipicolinate reductase [Bacteroidales bacterium]
MNFALIGYGKMGRTIEALGKMQGHSFPVIIDVHNREQLSSDKLKEIDAAIEFSTPSVAPENIKDCINMGVPVVSGTTGWNEMVPEVEAYCREKNGALFYTSNFSVGVNILFALNRKLAEIMDQFPEYSVSINEVHHVHKKDAPSGTAISLAQQILEVNKQLSSWNLKGTNDPQGDSAGQLPIEAVREGEVKGQHSIHYESVLDSITLSHDAFTRDAFAAGVLLAAKFIKDRKGIFGMQDLLKL